MELKIDNLTTEAKVAYLVGFVGSLEDRIRRLEQSGCDVPITAPANDVVQDTPKSPSALETVELHPGTSSIQTEATHSKSVPQTPVSPSELKFESPAMVNLLLKIEEARSKGIGLISIRAAIQRLIDEQQSLA